MEVGIEFFSFRFPSLKWCIGHVTDDDFVSFFKRAKAGLEPGGFLVLKENIAKTGFVLDNKDRSITRSDIYFKELFRHCGLNLYKSKVNFKIVAYSIAYIKIGWHFS